MPIFSLPASCVVGVNFKIKTKNTRKETTVATSYLSNRQSPVLFYVYPSEQTEIPLNCRETTNK